MAFRLLYSGTSNILSVHVVSFNPFLSSSSDSKSRPSASTQQPGVNPLGASAGWQGSDLPHYMHILEKLLLDRADASR